MIESTITKVGLGIGFVFTLVYVLRCVKLKKTPDLAMASVCVLTGVGAVIGPILILNAFTDTFKEVQPKPEHLGLAGLAILWVSWQFIHRIWVRADDSPPTIRLNDQAIETAPKSNPLQKPDTSERTPEPE